MKKEESAYERSHCYSGKKNVMILIAHLFFFGAFVIGPKIFLG